MVEITGITILTFFVVGVVLGREVRDDGLLRSAAERWTKMQLSGRVGRLLYSALQARGFKGRSRKEGRAK